jgi:hypothetical protein
VDAADDSQQVGSSRSPERSSQQEDQAGPSNSSPVNSGPRLPPRRGGFFRFIKTLVAFAIRSVQRTLDAVLLFLLPHSWYQALTGAQLQSIEFVTNSLSTCQDIIIDYLIITPTQLSSALPISSVDSTAICRLTSPYIAYESSIPGNLVALVFSESTD